MNVHIDFLSVECYSVLEQKHVCLKYIVDAIVDRDWLFPSFYCRLNAFLDNDFNRALFFSPEYLIISYRLFTYVQNLTDLTISIILLLTRL